MKLLFGIVSPVVELLYQLVNALEHVQLGLTAGADAEVQLHSRAKGLVQHPTRQGVTPEGGTGGDGQRSAEQASGSTFRPSNGMSQPLQQTKAYPLQAILQATCVG